MNIFGFLIVFAVILFSMVLHELAHGVVAHFLGDDTAKDEGRLTLNPLKHIDPVMSLVLPLLLFIAGGPIFGGAKPVPINSRNLKWREWGMALVALAGPLTNFLIAFIGFLIGHFTGWIYGDDMLQMFFSYLVITNIGFAVFNMIPIPPLDGSRILYAIAPDSVRTFMLNMERYGIIVVYALVAFGVFSNLIAGAINGIARFFYWIIGM